MKRRYQDWFGQIQKEDAVLHDHLQTITILIIQDELVLIIKHHSCNYVR